MKVYSTSVEHSSKKVFLASVFKTYSALPITYYSLTLDNLTSHLEMMYPRLDLNNTDEVIIGFKDIPEKELKNYTFV